MMNTGTFSFGQPEVIYSDEDTIPKPGLPVVQGSVDPVPQRVLMAESKRCYNSYVRDFMVENSDFKKERIERPGVPPMRLAAFSGCAAILKRRVKINNQKLPIIRMYKCIDRESEQEMLYSGMLPQQADDQMKCVITCTDLTLEKTIQEQFSGDDSRFSVFIVNPKSLLDDGWTPYYDRGYVYWYPPIIQQYLYGGPEFSDRYLPEQCIDY